MTHPSTRYLRTLKAALTGDAGTPLVFVCNFEAEAQWATHYVGLPGPAPAAVSPVVARMEELGALLAGPDDYLALKQPLDEGYRAYLADLGIALPTALVPERTAPDRSTTEDLLASPRMLGQLAELGRQGALLMPMGTSCAEQRLAHATHTPLAVPGAAIFEKVNSKIYSRALTEEAGLRAVPGWSCESVGDLERVLAHLQPDLAAGQSVVIKDAYGVSGKGLLLLDAPAKAVRLMSMVRRRAARTDDDRLSVVVERWIPKRFDLNYQITIDRLGQATLDFAKQAITDGGVHQGHVIPADLSNVQEAQLRVAAREVGRRLYADGFTGVAGIDAIVAADGGLYPVLEINARLNMSSYQGGLCELFVPTGYAALACHYPLRMAGPVSFRDVRRALGPLLCASGGSRLIITCFGTVNANAATRRPPYHGRLYAMLVAPDRARLSRLDVAARTALGQLVLAGTDR